MAARIAIGTGIAGYIVGRYVPHNKDESRKIRKSELYNKFANVAVVGIRKLLDPERAHNFTVKLTSYGLGPVEPDNILSEEQKSTLQTNVWNCDFSSPLGLAAGFDKQGEAVSGIFDMGFSFLEVGGVPPLPQPGNEKPRMFRLTEDNAVINRFGLNSEGMQVVKERLQKFNATYHSSPSKGIVGVNLAKNTVSDDAAADFITGVQELGPITDFVVVNVSCPNVAWTSQYKKAGDGLTNLIQSVKKERDALVNSAKSNGIELNLPLLIKIGPDMSIDAKKDMAKLILKTKVDGVVVTNTSSERPSSLKSEHAQEKGGLSGEPIREKSLETLRDMYALTKGKVPLIGVGGISSAQDAYDRIRAGASLLEIYTALVYQGPGLVSEIKVGLAERLKQDGFNHISEAVGADHK